MKNFRQIYSIEKENLTKKEMLIEIGYDEYDSEKISKKVKKDVIYSAWLNAYNKGNNFDAVRMIRREMN